MQIITGNADGQWSPVNRPLGRNTTDTINSAEHWMSLIPPVPNYFSGLGETVEVSPPLWKFCPGGFDNQWIGMCVGKSVRNLLGMTLRIPRGAKWDPNNPDSLPGRLANVRLSGLWAYWKARTTHGRAGFGEGAVVAYALDALRIHGFIPESLWADTQANQNAYRDGFRASQEQVNFGQAHKVAEAHSARIRSRQQALDLLAAGYGIADGVSIGQGWMNTAPDGRFSLGGRTVGGHATVKVGFDKKLNRLYHRNSWYGWGMQTDDPEFNSDDPALGGNAKGRNNIGYCPLDEYLDTHYTDRKLQSGETDAFVVDDAPWEGRENPEPKIEIFSAVELF